MTLCFESLDKWCINDNWINIQIMWSCYNNNNSSLACFKYIQRKHKQIVWCFHCMILRFNLYSNVLLQRNSTCLININIFYLTLFEGKCLQSKRRWKYISWYMWRADVKQSWWDVMWWCWEWMIESVMYQRHHSPVLSDKAGNI